MIDLQNKTLIEDSEVDWEVISPDCRRKIMAYDDDLMLVKVAFKTGGVGSMHHHPHLQMSYVVSGEFEVSIGEEHKILKGGDVFFVPSEAVHGVVCLQEGMLIDVFNPARKDFLE